MATSPECQVCGAQAEVQFSIIPVSDGFKFGQICVPCDEKVQSDKEDRDG